MATDHQKKLEAWRDLWGQYKAIIDAFDGLIYIVSPSHEIEFVNHGVVEMIGFSPMGKKCHKAFYHLDHRCQECPQEKVLKGETVRREFPDTQNTHRYYSVSTPLYLQGKVFMMVTIQHLSKTDETPKDVVEIDGLIENPTDKNAA